MILTKTEKRAQKRTDPSGTPQKEALQRSIPQSSPNAQNENIDTAMNTTTIENNAGFPPTPTLDLQKIH